MSVALDTLVTPLKWSLNVPGETGMFNFDDTVKSEWVEALAAGFWWANTRGFAKDYRVSVEGGTIENVTGSGPDDLSNQLQMIVVLFTALNALEAKMLSLPTHKAVSAKPGLSTETDRSAQLLRDLLAARRADLEELKLLIVGGTFATEVKIIDAFLARDTSLRAGTSSFVV